MYMKKHLFNDVCSSKTHKDVYQNQVLLLFKNSLRIKDVYT